MTKLMPYLLFDGTCREAMAFYQSCLGGELTLTNVKDSPAKDQMSAAQQDKVINAHLSADQMEVSASDWLAPNATPVRGNTVGIFLSGGTLPDAMADMAMQSPCPAAPIPRPQPSSTTEILSAFDESVPRARKVLTGLDFGRTHLLFVQNSKDCYIFGYPQMPGAYVKSIAGA